MNVRSLVALMIFVAASFGTAALGALVTDVGLKDWYPALTKPFFNPANWIFPIVWTALFALMAVAAWLVWRCREEMPDLVRPALLLFFVQLIFNAVWSFAFFGMRSPFAGLVVIIPFLILLIEMARRYRPISEASFWMTVPYIAWVSFATILNLSIWWLNRAPAALTAG